MFANRRLLLSRWQHLPNGSEVPRWTIRFDIRSCNSNMHRFPFVFVLVSFSFFRFRVFFCFVCVVACSCSVPFLLCLFIHLYACVGCLLLFVIQLLRCCAGPCQQGYFGSTAGQNASTCTGPCKAGSYGSDTGLKNNSCDGFCAPGYVELCVFVLVVLLFGCASF